MPAKISHEKAKKILDDGSVQGHKLTPKQRRFFGHMTKAAHGTAVAPKQREIEIIPHKYSEAKSNIIAGMQDGGGIFGPTFAGAGGMQANQTEDPAEGLRAVASVVAALGEPGLQALKLGLLSARQKYGAVLSAVGNNPFPGVPRTQQIPSFDEILRSEVGSAWASVGAPKPSSKPTAQPSATPTPFP
jgi:hypothetical protein